MEKLSFTTFLSKWKRISYEWIKKHISNWNARDSPRPITQSFLMGIAWAELSKDWLPSDLQPPSRHTFYISVSICGCMLSELHVHRRVETLFRKWDHHRRGKLLKAAVLFLIYDTHQKIEFLCILFLSSFFSKTALFISSSSGIAVRKALSSSDTTGGIDSKSSGWAFLGLEVYNLSKNWNMY